MPKFVFNSRTYRPRNESSSTLMWRATLFPMTGPCSLMNAKAERSFCSDTPLDLALAAFCESHGLPEKCSTKSDAASLKVVPLALAHLLPHDNPSLPVRLNLGISRRIVSGSTHGQTVGASDNDGFGVEVPRDGRHHSRVQPSLMVGSTVTIQIRF